MGLDTSRLWSTVTLKVVRNPLKPKRPNALYPAFLINTKSNQMKEDSNKTTNPSSENETNNITMLNPEPNHTKEEDEEEELHKLLMPNLSDLPPTPPPSAIDTNFITYYVTDFLKPGHDQYIHRHANGLCVIGLAQTHVALKDNHPVSSVDFNVGKSNRSEIKVTGKHKKNALHFQPETILCKVLVEETSYVVRCCVKGSLLEVNERLIKKPQLLNSSAEREGYIAIIMPRPADWLKFKSSALVYEEYNKLRGLN